MLQGLGTRMQAERQALLLIFTWHLGRRRPRAGQQQRMEEEPAPRAVLPIVEEPWDRRMLNTPDATALSKRLESLGLQSWLGWWQKSRGQELGRSAGTRSCPFTPAGMGLTAAPGVVRPPCALLLCGREPR